MARKVVTGGRGGIGPPSTNAVWLAVALLALFAVAILLVNLLGIERASEVSKLVAAVAAFSGAAFALLRGRA
jgi:hypothetical protein